MCSLVSGKQFDDFFGRVEVHLVPDMLIQVLSDPGRGVAELLACQLRDNVHQRQGLIRQRLGLSQVDLAGLVGPSDSWSRAHPRQG